MTRLAGLIASAHHAHHERLRILDTGLGFTIELDLPKRAAPP
jgi:hypothetical protein